MTENRNQVAAIQLASSPNVSANLIEVDRLVQEAAKNGAGMIVLPENFAFMGMRETDICSLREKEGDGPLQDHLKQLAKRLEVWIVGGTLPLEADDSSKVRASCLVYDDTGAQVSRYDKIHLFDVNLPAAKARYTESASIEAGDKTKVLDTPFGKLGMAICYDLRFPELFRDLMDQGMEIAVMPVSFTAVTGKAHWEVLVRARAIENLCYVVAAAQGGFHINGRETYGHSMIVAPWGNILDESPSGNNVISANIDIEYLNTTRRNFPTIKHRKL